MQVSLDRLALFLGGDDYILRLSLINKGPSHSGFASSSAVSLNLLHACYQAMGDHERTDTIILANLTWIFENSLGLRSGRQDIDGPLLGGIHSIHYSNVIDPEMLAISNIETRDIDSYYEDIPSSLLLVDTGIPRTKSLDLRRGLNIRHLRYLSGNSQAIIAMKKSHGIHSLICKAFSSHDWERWSLIRSIIL